ncbi:MAG TPA: AarF/UbiB family protein [Anaerolineales bacterium]|nr:AarF/UbiB family protein [Anaerolineales bacterium]
MMYRARYRKIVFFFARMLASIFFWSFLLPRIGLKKLSQQNQSKRLSKAARDYRNLAVQMGGVLIKVGQFLSSRVDVLPPEFTTELEGLQDEVPAEEFSDIREVAEQEFGMTLEEKFSVFDPKPLAAASLGQVHFARINPLDEHLQPALPISSSPYNVVVKVQRPNIEQLIATDLAALSTVAKWLDHYKPIRKRANVPQLLEEFTSILYEEIDYLAEGRNAETFSQNFSDYPDVRVPKIIWTHTTRRALTLENVLAIKITDYKSISQAGISRADVASRLLDTYLKQIFEDGFFHADPHPGNLFIQPITHTQDSANDTKNQWDLTFVDFGMVGQVPEKLRKGLRELLIAVGTQDSSKVIKAYQMMDVLLPSADLEAIEKASAKVFDKFWGKNMSELTAVKLDEIREFADEFRDLIFDLPFQVPQNIIFLARAVGILSGMCTGLDPEFNLWDHLAPYAKKLIADEALSGAKELWTSIERQIRALVLLPARIDSILENLDQGKIALRTPELSKQVDRLEKAVNRLASAIIIGVLLSLSIQLYLNDELYLAIALTVAAAIIVRFTLSATKRNGSS